MQDVLSRQIEVKQPWVLKATEERSFNKKISLSKLYNYGLAIL